MLIFGIQIHFYVSRGSKTWKHFDFLIFPFSFLSQIYISSNVELNSNLVLCVVVVLHSD